MVAEDARADLGLGVGGKLLEARQRSLGQLGTKIIAQPARPADDPIAVESVDFSDAHSGSINVTVDLVGLARSLANELAGGDGQRAGEEQQQRCGRRDPAGTDAMAQGGEVAKRAFQAMMEMNKIDVAKIEAAVRGQVG